MIDTRSEEIIPLRAVCQLFPGRKGKGVAVATVWRWVMQGRKGVRLESLIVGGVRYSSSQAVARFLDGLNALTPGGTHHPPDGERAAERAGNLLDSEGF